MIIIKDIFIINTKSQIKNYQQFTNYKCKDLRIFVNQIPNGPQQAFLTQNRIGSDGYNSPATSFSQSS